MKDGASLDRLTYVHWRGIVPAIGYYLLSAPRATQPIPTAELPAEPTPTVAPVRPLTDVLLEIAGIPVNHL